MQFKVKYYANKAGIVKPASKKKKPMFHMEHRPIFNMNIQVLRTYINDNKSTLISEAKTLFNVLNETTFSKAVVNNIKEQSQEWSESVIVTDETIKAVATRYYRESIAK